MTFASSPELRRRMYLAYNTRAYPQRQDHPGAVAGGDRESGRKTANSRRSGRWPRFARNSFQVVLGGVNGEVACAMLEFYARPRDHRNRADGNQRHRRRFHQVRAHRCLVRIASRRSPLRPASVHEPARRAPPKPRSLARTGLPPHRWRAAGRDGVAAGAGPSRGAGRGMVKACLFRRMTRMWNGARTRGLHGLADGGGRRWRWRFSSRALPLAASCFWAVGGSTARRAWRACVWLRRRISILPGESAGPRSPIRRDSRPGHTAGGGGGDRAGARATG